MPLLARTFTEFIHIPIVFYKTIGEDLYEHRSSNRVRRLLLKLLLHIGFVNFNLLVMGEIIFFVKALRSSATILEATGVAPCIGFSFVANFKQIAMTVHRVTLRQHFDQMEEIFPKTVKQQNAYKLPQRERVMRRVMSVFTLLCLAYTTTFSIYPALKASVQYWLLDAPVFERSFGFAIWYPYKTTEKNWVYWLTYLGQVHGAYLAGVAFLSADLVLVASVTQLCMHFDFISRCLEEFGGASQSDVQKDLEYLKTLIVKHAKCLKLSEHVNSIFSFSLLLNFLTASLTICFIGFQVTASSKEDIVKYIIFLTASLVQVFVVCYYGDELMTASMRVGDAAYNQNWFDCDKRYKRLLTILIMRSQKPASIRAPFMPPISFRAYMKVISMSYQFFALLRTSMERKGTKFT
ncbi:PREDICTED: odorant receptor 67c-like [Rhagoletis zephyria]|uniref:odorant receptor 67c-like n=1 Tax=Rhagoletis zephyria TaxID=28612 RepID=UPI0008117C49|nr:PREDICTED: odorant receptor 67c-like [Rhagoletis zephyria]